MPVLQRYKLTLTETSLRGWDIGMASAFCTVPWLRVAPIIPLVTSIGVLLFYCIFTGLARIIVSELQLSRSAQPEPRLDPSKL